MSKALDAPLLHRRFPDAREKLPWCALSGERTPVAPMTALANRAGMAQLFVKRDDLTHSVWGGSDVRKLEFILAAAEQSEAHRIVTDGPLGSDFATALAVHGLPMGLKTDLVASTYGSRERHHRLSAEAEQAGLHVHPVLTPLGARMNATARRLAPGRVTSWGVERGGGPTGALGFINAALELREQVQAGDLPEPAAIFVAADTSATLAGLAIGLHIAGLESRAVGVAVGPRWRVTERRLGSMIDRTVALLRGAGCREVVPPSQDRYVLIHGFAGTGTNRATDASRHAVALARDVERLHLEPYRTGKVLSALLDQALSWHEFRESPVLFWNTAPDT